jgi:hypothetical protein
MVCGYWRLARYPFRTAYTSATRTTEGQPVNRSYKVWALAHPVGRVFVGFLVYITAGLAVIVALGGRVPWFGFAVAACVWAVMTLWVWRRAR